MSFIQLSCRTEELVDELRSQFRNNQKILTFPSLAIPLAFPTEKPPSYNYSNTFCPTS